ncbi:MAG: hypothetical protein ACFB51_17265 [Anaerolineae bacterium]
MKTIMPEQSYARPRLKNLVVGLVQAKSVHLTHIARKVPLDRQKLSIVKRFRRLLSSPVIQVLLNMGYTYLTPHRSAGPARGQPPRGGAGRCAA